MTGRTHAPPSAESASALVRGERGALPTAVLHAAFRTGLVAIGLKAAGVPERHLLRGAIGGALAIEAFLLFYAAQQERAEAR